MRNNSQIAISNNHSTIVVAGNSKGMNNGAQSVLSHHSNAGVMSRTKRLVGGEGTSSKWLPAVSNEKKSRPGKQQNVTQTI